MTMAACWMSISTNEGITSLRREGERGGAQDVTGSLCIIIKILYSHIQSVVSPCCRAWVDKELPFNLQRFKLCKKNSHIYIIAEQYIKAYSMLIPYGCVQKSRCQRPIAFAAIYLYTILISKRANETDREGRTHTHSRGISCQCRPKE